MHNAMAIATNLLLILYIAFYSSSSASAFISHLKLNPSAFGITYRNSATILQRSSTYEIRKDYVVTNEEYHLKKEAQEEYALGQKILVEKPPLSASETYEKQQGRGEWKAYHNVQKLLKAGTLDVPRIFHSLLGFSSILVGLHHMVEVLIISSFTDVECDLLTIILSGCVHTFAGLLGIRRLNFKNKKEAARNAMFWPAPIQSFWLASASLTEWGYVLDAF